MNEYFELRIKINPDIAEILSSICFENLDCDGVVLAEEIYKDDLVLVSTTQDILKVYLKKFDNIELFLDEQKKLLLDRGFSEFELGSWEFEIEKIENQDWSKKWKENWDITIVSDNIKIVPSWIEYQPKPNEITITLDPGTAFGTGTHPTTQLCMRAIEKYIKINDKMADIGMGSGILAICGIKCGAKYVYGCDNDESVIETAIENSRKNSVADKCKFEINTADKINNKFDFISANILHNVLADIMGYLKNIMTDDAKLVLSGIMDEKKQVVLDAIKKYNLEVIEQMHQDIWTAFVVKK